MSTGIETNIKNNSEPAGEPYRKGLRHIKLQLSSYLPFDLFDLFFFLEEGSWGGVGAGVGAGDCMLLHPISLPMVSTPSSIPSCNSYICAFYDQHQVPALK